MDQYGSVLEGRIALITGGASGISRAMASAMGKAGARLWIGDIDADGGARAVSELRAEKIQADSVRLDVTDRGSVEEAIGKVLQKEGRLDVLFNGAGIIDREPVLELSEEVWDRVLTVNLKGTFLCAQAAAKVMVPKGHGRIINVVSGLAEGNPRSSAYASSKAGVIALTKSLASAMRALKVDVTVNAIAPGPTDTPMWRGGKSPQQIEELLASGQINQPADMSSVVVFLASAQSWPLNGRLLERG